MDIRRVTAIACAGVLLAGTPAPAAAPPAPVGQGELRGSGGRTLDRETTRSVEAALQAAGLDPGPVDGLVSAETRQAVRQYQRARGLRVNGSLDSETLSSLLSGRAAPAPPSR